MSIKTIGIEFLPFFLAFSLGENEKLRFDLAKILKTD